MLLMKDPSYQDIPAECQKVVTDGSAAIVPVKRGQLLTITDIEGGRSAQLFAFTDSDLREFLSPHHTRVFSNSYILTLGMRLVTNRRRPMMVLGKDNVRSHDLLLPAATEDSLKQAGLKGRGCLEVITQAIHAAGLRPIKIPDPVNLFLNVTVRQDGTLDPRPLGTPPGSSVTFRVVLDCHAIVAACSSDLGSDHGRGPVEIRVHNEL
jgi:uncharacterized protein